MRRMVYCLALALMFSPIAGAQSRWELTKNGSWKGVVVDGACYKKLGADKAMAADQKACAALQGVVKGEVIGIFSDDDGYMQILGTLTSNKNAALLPWIGKRVAITGSSSRDAFSARFVEVAKIAATK